MSCFLIHKILDNKNSWDLLFRGERAKLGQPNCLGAQLPLGLVGSEFELTGTQVITRDPRGHTRELGYVKGSLYKVFPKHQLLSIYIHTESAAPSTTFQKTLYTP